MGHQPDPPEDLAKALEDHAKETIGELLDNNTTSLPVAYQMVLDTQHEFVAEAVDKIYQWYLTIENYVRPRTLGDVPDIHDYSFGKPIGCPIDDECFAVWTRAEYAEAHGRIHHGR